jgi:hypothetical protein
MALEILKTIACESESYADKKNQLTKATAPVNGEDPATAPVNGEDPATAPVNGEDPATAPVNGEDPSRMRIRKTN